MEVKQSYLPSKRFLYTVGSGILLIAVIFLGLRSVKYLAGLKKFAGNSSGTQNNALLDSSAEAELDTDGDGLKDWEEVLWKTDINKTDTDGDATDDGVEITAGRNPLVAGMVKGTAYTDVLKKPSEAGAGAKNASQSLTEKMGQEFAQRYFAGKGVAEDEALGSESKQMIADALARNIEQGTAAYASVFAEKDLNISNAVSPKAYLNGVGATLRDNFNGIEVSELAVLDSILVSKDFSQATLLDRFASAYAKSVMSLRKTPVPPLYASAHLALLNGFQNTLFAVRDMRVIERDPARALVGLRVYLNESNRSREYLALYKNQVAKDGIAFTKEEPGAFFAQYFSKL